MGSCIKKIFIFIYLFSLHLNAQEKKYYSNNTHTDPSKKDLSLIHTAVSKCEILADVVNQIQSQNLEAGYIFNLLQQTDIEGNFLIDDPECKKTILEFVSSICTSDAEKNNDYCKRLGFSKTQNDYKSYGSSQMSQLSQYYDTQRLVSIDPSFSLETQRLTLAGTLFTFTPVKRLKLIKPVSKVVSKSIKPVLSGAMLVLATLGLSACDDLTGPSQLCNTGHKNVFKIETEDEEYCVRIPVFETVFIDNEGNEFSSFDPSKNLSIKIKFDSKVVYLDENGWATLSKSEILNMLSFDHSEAGDLFDSVFTLNNVTIGTENNRSTIIINPPSNIFLSGQYTVSFENIANSLDASIIANGDNTQDYLRVANPEDSFIVDNPNPCDEGNNDYYQLHINNQNSWCIKLPKAQFTKSGTDQFIRNKIWFDTEIVYIHRGGDADEDFWAEITQERLFEMLSINNGEGDLVEHGGEIGLDKLTFGISDGRTWIDILPPTNGYAEGAYTLLVTNFASREDAPLIISTNGVTEEYLERSKQQHYFEIGEVITPCDSGEYGWFQLKDENDLDLQCIELPKVTFNYSGSDDVTIRVEFNTEIKYLDDNGWGDLTKARVLEMLNISNGNDLEIGVNNISYGVTGGKTYIEILPPTDGYVEGTYEISIKDFAKHSDASIIYNSNNKDGYLEYIENINKIVDYFEIGSVETPCDRHEDGWFQLEKDGQEYKCIELPKVESFTISGTEPNLTLNITFDSEIKYIDDETEAWGELTKIRILDMLEIINYHVSESDDLAEPDGEIGPSKISFNTVNGKTIITISPPDFGYQDGVYVVSIEHFVKSDDGPFIFRSENLDDYLNKIKKQELFEIGEVITPCDEGRLGWFQLEKDGEDYKCIKIPEVESFTTTGTGSNLILNITFDSQINFIDETGWEGLTQANILEMLEVKNLTSGGDDLAEPDIENGIGLSNIHFSNSNSKTTITIQPPYYGYLEGTYEVKFNKLANKTDASFVFNSDNLNTYLTDVDIKNYFEIGNVITPCDEGRSGWFQLEKDDLNYKCIKLPTAIITPPANASSNITITFDSEISYIDDDTDTYGELTKADVLKMLSIDNGGGDLVESDGEIGVSKINITSTNPTVITINPPDFGYVEGAYEVTLSNFVKSTDGAFVVNSDSMDDYLRLVKVEDYFEIGNVITPCDEGRSGWFQLEKDGQDYKCIELPRINIKHIDSDDTELNLNDVIQDPNVKIRIEFDSSIAYIDEEGWLPFDENSWGEQTKKNILEMINLHLGSAGNDLVVLDGPIGLSKIRFGELTNGNSYLEFDSTDGGYIGGDYELLLSKFVKEEDGQFASNADNTEDYLPHTNIKHYFSVTTIGTPCDKGEIGWFQLKKDGENFKCIEIPEVEITYCSDRNNDGEYLDDPDDPTNNECGIYQDLEGNEIEIGNDTKLPIEYLNPTDPRMDRILIKIKFDTDVAFITEQNGDGIWDNLTIERVFDMVDIKPIIDCQDDSQQDCSVGRSLLGSEILMSDIEVDKDDDNKSYITIEPPQYEIPQICTERNEETDVCITWEYAYVCRPMYRVSVEDYVKLEDAQDASTVASNDGGNLSELLDEDYITEYSFFELNLDSNGDDLSDIENLCLHNTEI